MTALPIPGFRSGSYLYSFAQSQSARLSCCSLHVSFTSFKKDPLLTNQISVAGRCDGVGAPRQHGTNRVTKLNSQFLPILCLGFAQPHIQDSLSFDSPENALSSISLSGRSGSTTQTKGGLR